MFWPGEWFRIGAARDSCRRGNVPHSSMRGGAASRSVPLVGHSDQSSSNLEAISRIPCTRNPWGRIPPRLGPALRAPSPLSTFGHGDPASVEHFVALSLPRVVVFRGIDEEAARAQVPVPARPRDLREPGGAAVPLCGEMTVAGELRCPPPRRPGEERITSCATKHARVPDVCGTSGVGRVYMA